MGSSNSLSQSVLELQENQLKYDSFISIEITNSKNEIKRLTYSIGAKKNEIFDKINKETDYQISNEVKNYYNLIKQKEELNKNLISLENIKAETEIPSKELKGENKRKQEEIDKLINKSDLISSHIDILKNKNEFSVKEKENITPTGESFEEEGIVNNFCNLKNQLIQEQMGNEQRKRYFRINFNTKNYNSFTYPDWLQSSLKYNLIDIETSFKQYENALSSYNEQIKDSIKKILNEKNNFYEASMEYNNLKMNIQQTISSQKRKEADSINRKNTEITNAFII